MKNIILCADDYGQNIAVSQAIIMLLKQKRLSATSCLTTAIDWPLHASGLLPYKNQVDIGLHFNLTEGQPLSQNLRAAQGFMPLKQLILRAYSGRLQLDAIRAELNAQLDAFTAALGQLPHFIDGHQHIHQLPMVRNVLFDVYAKRLRGSSCYLRCTDTPQLFLGLNNPAYLKSMLIQCLGARAFKAAVLAQQIPHNTGFGGVYAFAQAVFYPQIFRYFLTRITAGGIIMCHPGLEQEGSTDPIAEARYHEFCYFQGEQFLEDCNFFSIKV